MNNNQIKQKIKEVENQLEIIRVDMVTADYYEKLLHLHVGLWKLLYFKTNQEEKYLEEPIEEEPEEQ